MSATVRLVNKWRGYYAEDCDCIYCLFYGGARGGCSLERCCCEEEKLDAALYNPTTSMRDSMS